MGEREDRFTRLFASAYGPLWAYARRRVPASDVDDIVAEVLTVAWRRLDHVPDDESSLAWLYGVAYKVVGNHLRSQRRRLRLAARLAAEPASAEPSSDPGVIEALSALRPEDREVLRLAAWEGLGAPQIAIVLGCSSNAAALRLSRARARLRDRLTGSASSRTQARRKEIDV
ncbi:MAG: sigma-70 family RNA polymerase sigma factor [Actinomycetota bacterium]